MTYETVLYTKGDDGIARVSLNRPNVLNAINYHCLLYTSDAADE